MAHEVENELTAPAGPASQHTPPPAELRPEDPAAEAVLAALAEGIRRMGQHDPAARQGRSEGVHGMRTSTRRLRSTLRTFRALVVADWARPLEEELHWLAGVLGAVRDLDVLEARLEEAAAELSGALGFLFAALRQRHEAASAALREALAGERYRALLDRLEEALAHPSLADRARDPCRDALPPLVAGSWKSLKKRGRALGPHDPDDDFHDVRKRAKRLRYAAELVADGLEPHRAKGARRFAKLATRVQDVLGEFHDAVVATQEVNRIVADHPADGPFNLAAGRLLERETCAAQQARDRFFKAWDRLDRKARRRWLKS